MNLGPELNDKWLTWASEAVLPPSGPSAVRTAQSRHLPNHHDGPPAPRGAEGSLRKRSRFPQRGAQSGDHALVARDKACLRPLRRRCPAERAARGYAQRIATRSTNPFGKAAQERQRILADMEAVEPLLRATSTVEIVTTIPVTKVVDAPESLARRADGGSGGRSTRP